MTTKTAPTRPLAVPAQRTEKPVKHRMPSPTRRVTRKTCWCYRHVAEGMGGEFQQPANYSADPGFWFGFARLVP